MHEKYITFYYMKKYILIVLFVILCSYIGAKVFIYTLRSDTDNVETFSSSEISSSTDEENICLRDTLNEIKKNRKQEKIDESLNGTCSFQMNTNYLNLLNPTQFDNDNICCLNHDKCKPNTEVICSYGPTNYPDPLTLSQFDKLNFMQSKVHYFTLQDYINWLKCFENNKSSLNYKHLKNLEKVLNGQKPIFDKEIKQSEFIPPITSEDYFNDKIMSYESEIVKNNVPTIPYNYDSYPNFSKNFQTLGLIGQKNDTFGKYNANLVNNFTRPKISN